MGAEGKPSGRDDLHGWGGSRGEMRTPVGCGSKRTGVRFSCCAVFAVG